MMIIVLATIVYYVFLGLAICVIINAHKLSIPYAVLMVIALWPIILIHASYILCREIKSK